MGFWFKSVTLFLIENLDLGTDEKVLPQGIHMWNMKAISLPFKKSFNPLPDDKILNLSKLKAFAGEKINVSEKLKFP